jgi:hypothetical protein
MTSVVFKVSNGHLSLLDLELPNIGLYSSFCTEKILKDLVSNNISQFIKGAHFIKTEFCIHGWNGEFVYPDILAVDKYGTVFVIELKRDKDYGKIITQISAYQSALYDDTKAQHEVEKIVRTKYGSDLSRKINWDNIRGVGIARNFHRYSIRTAVKNLTELVKYDLDKSNEYLRLTFLRPQSQRGRTYSILSDAQLHLTYGTSQKDAAHMIQLVKSNKFLLGINRIPLTMINTGTQVGLSVNKDAAKYLPHGGISSLKVRIDGNIAASNYKRTHSISTQGKPYYKDSINVGSLRQHCAAKYPKSTHLIGIENEPGILDIVSLSTK